MVHPLDEVEFPAAVGRGDTFGISQVQDGCAAVAKRHAGVARVEKALAPEALQQRLAVARAGGQDEVGRQVLIFRTKSVGNPGAEGGPVA